VPRVPRVPRCAVVVHARSWSRRRSLRAKMCSSRYCGCHRALIVVWWVVRRRGRWWRVGEARLPTVALALMPVFRALLVICCGEYGARREVSRRCVLDRGYGVVSIVRKGSTRPCIGGYIGPWLDVVLVHVFTSIGVAEWGLATIWAMVQAGPMIALPFP
jgi:hypothetical protein